MATAPTSGLWFRAPIGRSAGWINSVDGYMRIAAVVEPETEETFRAYLVVEPIEIGSSPHGNRTRRSQVQILPPLLEKPRKRGFSRKRSALCRSGEAGYWVAAVVGGGDLGEVGVERLFAESAGDRGREESFDRSFALF
jgi:hypothetical protein